MDKIPITNIGFEKLEEELKILKSIDRPTVIKSIAEAREHGDLSENAEYHAAKEKQSFIEGRIADLENKISRAEVIITKKLKYLSDDQIVFLVGFPRSGTTLLDSILRSHSQIKVIEEKPYLIDLRHKYFESKKNNLSALLEITQKEKDDIRDNYMKHVMTNMEGKKIVIDKFPLLITEIGFINCIFPNAKIIFAVRHPCDVVISCFFTSFKINEAMIKFLDWQNTIDFYNKVLDLFVFYENELELKYKIIKYENVVKNFKYQITKLVEFLDLKYEKNLEKFYETAKNRSQILTPSYTQVINPLYTSSINRWKNYDQSKILSTSLSKWIKKFNY